MRKEEFKNWAKDAATERDAVIEQLRSLFEAIWSQGIERLREKLNC